MSETPRPPHKTYAFTDYFTQKVLIKRPYITKEMCIYALQHYEKKSPQPDGERIRFWAPIPQLEGKYLRVVTLNDETTIHNAFPDRGYKP